MSAACRSTDRSSRSGSRTIVVVVALVALSSTAVVGGLACGKPLTIADDDSPPILPDAADFPEGSVVLRDGAVLLPDGALVDGAAADSGVADAADDVTLDQFVPQGCPGPAACPRVMFVSSDAVGYTFAEPVAAAMHCNVLAAASPLAAVKGRQFEGWTSTTSSSAASRLVHGTMAYRDVTGVVIASNWLDLTDGDLTKSLFHDEKGGTTFGGAHVWTGTDRSGNAFGSNCSEWQSAAGSATRGVVGATDSKWTAFLNNDEDCGGSAHLYCIEK